MKRSVLTLILLVVALLPLTAAAQPQVKPDKAELARLAKLEKTQVAAKAAYLKNKKDSKAKQTYIYATMEVAKAYRVTPAVKSTVKYPKSLRYFREVRKVDPKNAKAIEYIEEMESIYRSIGKPIPPG